MAWEAVGGDYEFVSQAGASRSLGGAEESASAQLSPRPQLLLLPLGGLMPAKGVVGAVVAAGVPTAPKEAKAAIVFTCVVPEAGGGV